MSRCAPGDRASRQRVRDTGWHHSAHLRRTKLSRVQCNVAATDQRPTQPTSCHPQRHSRHPVTYLTLWRPRPHDVVRHRNDTDAEIEQLNLVQFLCQCRTMSYDIVRHRTTSSGVVESSNVVRYDVVRHRASIRHPALSYDVVRGVNAALGVLHIMRYINLLNHLLAYLLWRSAPSVRVPGWSYLYRYAT